MKGYLIIDTNEQGMVTAYTQYNMAVWTYLYNQLLEQRPQFCFELRESPDLSGRYTGIIEVFWKNQANQANLVEATA
jgi:hypothetical protein